MTETKKAPVKKRPTKKKPTAKKMPAKKKDKLPAPDGVEHALPRGQERLPDGTIRLSAKVHHLPDEPAEYSVHGVRMQLSGDVLVAGKDTNWLPMSNCAECKERRKEPVQVKRVDDNTVFFYKCATTGCKLNLTYVRVHTADTVVFSD